MKHPILSNPKSRTRGKMNNLNPLAFNLKYRNKLGTYKYPFFAILPIFQKHLPNEGDEGMREIKRKRRYERQGESVFAGFNIFNHFQPKKGSILCTFGIVLCKY